MLNRTFKAILGWLFFIGLVCSCGSFKSDNPGTYQSLKGEAQGTTFSIHYKDSLNRDFTDSVAFILSAFDKELSGYDTSSLVYRFNKNLIASINLSQTKYFKPCFEQSKQLAIATQGSFSVGLKPLLDFQRSTHAGNPNKLDSVLSIPYRFHVDDLQVLRKMDPRQQLDFNAIAQGYSVDVIALFLEGKGINAYYVEIGGELRNKGLNKRAKPWTTVLESPNSTLEDRVFMDTLAFSGLALATSGSYRQFNKINGQRYSHAIDPKTGRGVTHNLLSVSVLTDDAATADALATSFLVMGYTKSMEWIKLYQDNFEVLEAQFVLDTNHVFEVKYSSGFFDYRLD